MNALRVPKTMVSETFGRHPSDQCRAFNYFIKHFYDGFHHLVINNLQEWERNGLLERSAIAIEEKLGGHFQNRYVGFIDCNCLLTDRASVHHRRWSWIIKMVQ